MRLFYSFCLVGACAAVSPPALQAASIDEEREFAPIAQAYKQGRFESVRSLAQQFSGKYPDSKFRHDSDLFLAQAHLNLNDLTGASQAFETLSREVPQG